MPFDTLDPNVRSDWLTIGSASLLDGCTADRPMATRLLGNHLQAWRDAAALPVVIADGQSLPVLERYGYLWVHTGDGPQRTLFELPEYDESGRRIVDCGGITMPR